ncbi:AAA family ATPase [Macrococcus animalis]|uniref:AAA family ATPase n=1 Tax=Macrococcus animalis TaxID=3395467 RepID=UPI0039BE3CB1
MAKLIIIRGNSASGKTSTAKLLQDKLGEGTILVSQDMLRREMLRVKDKVGNVSTELLRTMIVFGMTHCKYVIVEGILTKSKHGDMLIEMINKYQNDAYVYYFDIPFEETLKRHQYKKNVDFGETEMRQWFLDKDLLGIDNEYVITEEFNQNQILELIKRQVMEVEQ